MLKKLSSLFHKRDKDLDYSESIISYGDCCALISNKDNIKGGLND